MSDNKKSGAFKQVITFDFDDTLTETQWDNDDECFKFIGPNKMMLATLRKHLRQGDKVHIVTSRHGPEMTAEGVVHNNGQPGIVEFLLEHLVDSDRRKIAGIHFTAGLKTGKLIELGSDRHFDDDFCELEALPSGCVGVRVKTLHGLD